MVCLVYGKIQVNLLSLPGAQNREFQRQLRSSSFLLYVYLDDIGSETNSLLIHYGRPLRSPHALYLTTPTPQRLRQLLPKGRPLCPQVQRHGRGPAFMHSGAARTSM